MTDTLDDGARDRLITEDDFVTILRKSAQQKEFFAFYDLAPADPTKWKRRHCTVLVELAHELETFLDEYHARGNRRFIFFGELVASLRNIGDAALVLNHLDVRFSQYTVQFGATKEEHGDRMWEFRSELTGAIRFANESLVKLLASLREEALRFGIEVNEQKPLGGHVKEDGTRARLPHDLDQEEVDEQGNAVAVLFHQFAQANERIEPVRAHLPRGGGYETLRKFVRDDFDETQVRAHETRVHNLQSAYDTFVKPTKLHAETAELRTFRGHVSLVLHLLEVAGHLVHFYERHESEQLRGLTKDRIAQLVPREQVLHHVVHFAARHAVDVLQRAAPLVQAVTPRFVRTQTLELALPDGVTLHARPLSLIVGVARHHKLPVEIVIDGQATSAASIMGLIMFVGRFPGVRKVAFRGDRAPLDDLKALFGAGLGERGLESLPSELDYLRTV